MKYRADSVSRYARAQTRHKKKLRIEFAEETAVAVEPIASTCWFFKISAKSLPQCEEEMEEDLLQPTTSEPI